MAYYTGNVANYEDLFDILINRCVDHGWNWSNGILSKGKAFLKVWVSAASQIVTADPGSGILVQGGTGQSGSALINPSAAHGRLGRPDISANWEIVAWPALYHLHIFENTDEVFLILNFNAYYHYWLTFGLSDVAGLPGTGLWFNGVTRKRAFNYQSCGFGLTVNEGYSSSNYNSTGFFCSTYNETSALYSPIAVHTGFDGIDWYGYGSAGANVVGSFSAWEGLVPLHAQSPNAWNQEAVLLPIHGYVGRPEGKRSCAVIVRNARYIRVDNYEIGDVITLGADQWRVYPFYFKNATERNCGYYKNHSGTFGWAIRV